jgi:hypothetical protein
MSMISTHSAMRHSSNPAIDRRAGEPISLWGEIYYRTSVILAGFVALLAAGNFIYKASEGDPWVPIFPLLLAIAIFLIGRALRFTLSARLD